MSPPKMENNDLWELHAIVHGRVQGVGFRATTRFYAQRLGLCGTVSNLPDGSVEIYAQGEKERLVQLLEELDKVAFPFHIERMEKATYQTQTKMQRFLII